nr:hypothetical protein [Rhizoctonia sp.]
MLNFLNPRSMLLTSVLAVNTYIFISSIIVIFITPTGSVENIGTQLTGDQLYGFSAQIDPFSGDIDVSNIHLYHSESTNSFYLQELHCYNDLHNYNTLAEENRNILLNNINIVKKRLSIYEGDEFIQLFIKAYYVLPNILDSCLKTGTYDLHYKLVDIIIGDTNKYISLEEFPNNIKYFAELINIKLIIYLHIILNN